MNRLCDMIIAAILVLFGIFIYNNYMEIKNTKAEMHGKIINVEIIL